LIWDATSQLYLADFSLNSNSSTTATLSFTGPNPIPTGLTPVFHLVGCNIPNSNFFDAYPNGVNNTFSFNFLSLPSGTFTVTSLEWVQNQLNLVTRTIQAPTSGPYSLSFDGQVVLYRDGNYYAVATSYQLPNQPAVPLTPTDGNTDTNSPTTIRVSESLPATSDFDMKIYYGTGDGNWVPMDEMVFFPKNVALQFKAEITSRSASSAKFVLRPSVGSQVTTFIDPGTSTVLGPTSISTYSANGLISLLLVQGH
jgi:hypothetical protein